MNLMTCFLTAIFFLFKCYILQTQTLFLYSWLLREDWLICSFGLMWKGYVSIGVRPANTWDFPETKLMLKFPESGNLIIQFVKYYTVNAHTQN